MDLDAAAPAAAGAPGAAAPVQPPDQPGAQEEQGEGWGAGGEGEQVTSLGGLSTNYIFRQVELGNWWAGTPWEVVPAVTREWGLFQRRKARLPDRSWEAWTPKWEVGGGDTEKNWYAWETMRWYQGGLPRMSRTEPPPLRGLTGAILPCKWGFMTEKNTWRAWTRDRKWDIPNELATRILEYTGCAMTYATLWPYYFDWGVEEEICYMCGLKRNFWPKNKAQIITTILDCGRPGNFHFKGVCSLKCAAAGSRQQAWLDAKYAKYAREDRKAEKRERKLARKPVSPHEIQVACEEGKCPPAMVQLETQVWGEYHPPQLLGVAPGEGEGSPPADSGAPVAEPETPPAEAEAPPAEPEVPPAQVDVTPEEKWKHDMERVSEGAVMRNLRYEWQDPLDPTYAPGLMDVEFNSQDCRSCALCGRVPEKWPVRGGHMSLWGTANGGRPTWVCSDACWESCELLWQRERADWNAEHPDDPK